jgi:SagB-type dehydrogenase family enzyme
VTAVRDLLPARSVSPNEHATRAYHERSKHRLSAYAAGPETLDWDAQPDPFRRFAGAALTPLPLVADALRTRWSELGVPGAVAPQAVNRDSVAALLELSLALTAWKEAGPDRWSVRANPSSGNLHPTEAYVLASGVEGLADGLHHYQPREHALALRRAGAVSAGQRPLPRLWLGLSSIHWREAWKYGERAFRYCQLDVGHALGAVRYAAATLGWSARRIEGPGHAALGALLGLDRDADFGTAEREEPEALLQIGPALTGTTETPGWTGGGPWSGIANRLDARPMYRWPVIDAVAGATRAPDRPARLDEPVRPVIAAPPRWTGLAADTSAARADLPAATLIRQRRSAQRFDRHAWMPRAALARLLSALRPDRGLPWDLGAQQPRVQLALWVHRVDGIPPGAWLLAHDLEGTQGSARPRPSAPDALPALALAPGVSLRPLAEHPSLAPVLRKLSCHQALAAEACVVFSLLAPLDLQDPWTYRELLQEAGLVGHALYLQAEAEGLSGTGIGCFFDDEVHGLLAPRDPAMQVLYQFTVGRALHDPRIVSQPPYDGLPLVPTMDPNRCREQTP